MRIAGYEARFGYWISGNASLLGGTLCPQLMVRSVSKFAWVFHKFTETGSAELNEGLDIKYALSTEYSG